MLCLGPDGALLTRPADIARSIWLASSFSDQLRWSVKGRTSQLDYDSLQELLENRIAKTQTSLSVAGRTNGEINSLDDLPSFEPLELDHEEAALANLADRNTDDYGDETTDHDPDEEIEGGHEFDNDWDDGSDPDRPEEP